MFEIPDDDEDFWESLPMDDITNVSESTTGQKRHGSENENVTRKKARIEADPTCQRENTVVTTLNFQDSHSAQSSNFQAKPGNDSQTSKSLIQTASNSDQYHVGTVNERQPKRSVSNNARPSTSVRLNCHGSDVQHSERDIVQTALHPNKMTNHQVRNENSDTAISQFNDQLSRSVHQDCLSNPGNFRTPDAQRDKQDNTHKHKKRKFPGPAGLLPRLNPGQSLEKVLIPGMSPQTRTEPPDESIILSSQSSDDMFSDTPWCSLLNDLQHHRHHVLNTFSVSASLQKASKKLLPDGKIALMLAVVESVDIQGPDACVVLKDRTAKVSGTMHRDAVKEYAADLHPGVALVLKQVSVVSPTCRTHYLNITSKNIVHLYGHRSSRSESIVSELRKTLHNVIQVANSQPTLQQPVTPNPRRTSPELAKNAGEVTSFRPPQMSTPRSQFPGQSLSSPRNCHLQDGNLSNNQTSTPSRKFNFKSVNSPNSPMLGASPVLPQTTSHKDNRPAFFQTSHPGISNALTPIRGQLCNKARMDTSCGATSATGTMRPQFNVQTNTNQPVPSKPPSTAKQSSDAELWHDDFSDELLSQLSEDMF